MYGIIYRAYLEDGRSYVGQTIKKLEKRIIAHKTTANKRPKYHFHKAINIYGFENFKWEILQECVSQEELNAAEIDWISKFNSIRNGFNENIGGRQSIMSENSKKKLSESRKGSNNPNYGKNSAMRGKGSINSDLIPTKFKDGHIPWNKGIKSGNKSKLSCQKAEEIRKLYSEGILIRELCQKFDVNHNTIHDVVANRIWSIDKCETYFKLKETIKELTKNNCKAEIQRITGLPYSKINKIIKDLNNEDILCE